jgi:TonB family protein
MNEPSTIEAPTIDADSPAEVDFALGGVPADGVDDSFSPDSIEDNAALRWQAVSPMARPNGRCLFDLVLAHPVVIAVVISLIVHGNLAVVVYWVMHARHAFVAACPQPVRGDGATALGAIDHDGNDEAPGAVGPASLTSGWSAPLQSGARPALDEPLHLDASDPPAAPASAPPPMPPDPSDPDPTPAAVAADVLVNPLQPDMLPVFARRPPALPDARLSPATAPVDRAVAEAQPSVPAPDELARPVPTTVPSPMAVATGKQLVGNTAGAMVAGFSSPASDKPGGLLRHAGPGGSNGKGGAVTGDGGNTVTGRPGTLAGVKGPPLHADYPDDCRRRGETGRVVIEVEVRADGSIASVKVLSDDGHPRLAEAALDAFQGRTFCPALLDGRPVRSTVKYPFVFELH